MSKKLQMTA